MITGRKQHSREKTRNWEIERLSFYSPKATATSGGASTYASMKVSDIMRRSIPCVSPGDSLQHVAKVLRDEELSLLPVCAEGVLVGIISDRDLAIRGAAEGVNPASTPLRELMNRGVFYCFEDQDCCVARKLMLENQVACLPVTDSRKHLVGMVYLPDILSK